jgi:hypothetical protein
MARDIKDVAKACGHDKKSKPEWLPKPSTGSTRPDDEFRWALTDEEKAVWPERVTSEVTSGDTNRQSFADWAAQNKAKSGMSDKEFKKMYEGSFETEEKPFSNTSKTPSYGKKGRFGREGYIDPMTGREQSRNAKEKIMSNKFLPFIVESSTPVNIFNTIMSRSKGMNTVLVTSIFNVVLNSDIKTLRGMAKELPEMPLEKLYEELVARHPHYAVDDQMLKIFSGLTKYISKDAVKSWSEKLHEFGVNDIMLFMLPMSDNHAALGEYTDMPFNKIVEDYDEIMNNVQEYVRFDDTGERMTFKTESDMKSYIFYRALLMDTDPTPFNSGAVIPVQARLLKDEKA